MSGFEPGEGWRSVNVGDYVAHRAEKLVRTSADGGERYWIWAPVPPLPTEPYTVIRVAWHESSHVHPVFTLIGDDWCNGSGQLLAADSAGITGFEVLAEPIPAGSAVYTSEQLNAILDGARAGTAKAVLDRVNDVLDGETPWITLMTRLLREFGVTS